MLYALPHSSYFQLRRSSPYTSLSFTSFGIVQKARMLFFLSFVASIVSVFEDLASWESLDICSMTDSTCVYKFVNRVREDLGEQVMAQGKTIGGPQTNFTG